MRLRAAIQGDLNALLTAELRNAERAVTAGVGAATDGLKAELRGQITGAGLGTRLANTWRGEAYPKSGQSIGAAGYVWSKAPGLVRLYAEGAIIPLEAGLVPRHPHPGGWQVWRRPAEDRARNLGAHPWSAAALRLSPGRALAADRRQRPADEARTGDSEHGPATGRCVHRAGRTNGRAAVHPRAASDGAQAARRQRRGAGVDRGTAAAHRAPLARVGGASSGRSPAWGAQQVEWISAPTRSVSRSRL